MNQIYNFEGARPPVLNEKMLRAEKERRKARLQAVLFMIADVIVMICIVVFARMIGESAPVAAAVCMIYAAVSAIGSGAAAIVYAQKGGQLYDLLE